MNWFMRRRLRAAFGAFMPKEQLEALVRDEIPAPVLEQTRVCHVLLQVRDDTADDVSRNVSDVIELIVHDGAFVENILSSLVSAVFPLEATARLDLIEATLGRLGSNVRAVYHVGDYPRGMFGSPIRMTYGTIVPNMTGAMERLLRLEFGTVARLGDEPEPLLG